MKQGQTNFEDLTTIEPAFGPLSADTEPTDEEIGSMSDMTAQFLELLHGPQKQQAARMLENTPELYQGVAQVAFTILQAVHQKTEQTSGPVPEAALFGEGAAIQTAVDEVFQYAQMLGIPGSESQDQYTASQMEMMRLVGEYIEKRGEDGAIGEAQDLMIDVEMAGNEPIGPQELAIDDMRALRSAREQSAAQGAPAPQGPQGAAPDPMQPYNVGVPQQ